MANNALCEYCEVDTGLGGIDGGKGGEYDGVLSPVWSMFQSLISSIVDIGSDLVLWAFCGVMEGMLFVAESIQFPDLINTLQATIHGLDPVIAYLIYRSSIPESLLIIGGGMTFYVLRKFVTLGNW